jgi:hypothetical protein
MTRAEIFLNRLDEKVFLDEAVLGIGRFKEADRIGRALMKTRYKYVKIVPYGAARFVAINASTKPNPETLSSEKQKKVHIINIFMDRRRKRLLFERITGRELALIDRGIREIIENTPWGWMFFVDPLSVRRAQLVPMRVMRGLMLEYSSREWAGRAEYNQFARELIKTGYRGPVERGEEEIRAVEPDEVLGPEPYEKGEVPPERQLQPGKPPTTLVPRETPTRDWTWGEERRRRPRGERPGDRQQRPRWGDDIRRAPEPIILDPDEELPEPRRVGRERTPGEEFYGGPEPYWVPEPEEPEPLSTRGRGLEDDFDYHDPYHNVREPTVGGARPDIGSQFTPPPRVEDEPVYRDPYRPGPEPIYRERETEFVPPYEDPRVPPDPFPDYEEEPTRASYSNASDAEDNSRKGGIMFDRDHPAVQAVSHRMRPLGEIMIADREREGIYLKPEDGSLAVKLTLKKNTGRLIYLTVDLGKWEKVFPLLPAMEFKNLRSSRTNPIEWVNDYTPLVEYISKTSPDLLRELGAYVERKPNTRTGMLKRRISTVERQQRTTVGPEPERSGNISADVYNYLRSLGILVEFKETDFRETESGVSVFSASINLGVVNKVEKALASGISFKLRESTEVAGFGVAFMPNNVQGENAMAKILIAVARVLTGWKFDLRKMTTESDKPDRALNAAKKARKAMPGEEWIF